MLCLTHSSPSLKEAQWKERGLYRDAQGRYQIIGEEIFAMTKLYGHFLPFLSHLAANGGKRREQGGGE